MKVKKSSVTCRMHDEGTNANGRTTEERQVILLGAIECLMTADVKDRDKGKHEEDSVPQYH